MDYEKELSKAKIALMQKPDSAFFSTILLSLVVKWGDSINGQRPNPTAATDGKHLWINPDFFMRATKGQRVFVLFHESQHVAYAHMGRLQSRNPERWNTACDHVINLQAKERGFEMWDWVLCDDKYKGMSAEEVYRLLPEDTQAPHMSDLVPSSMKPEAFDQHIKEILIRATMQSKMAGDKPGSVPGDIELYLDKLLNPKMKWWAILRKFMKDTCKIDYSFKLPNRRFFPQHHLPSLWGQSLLNFAVAVDISGSVSDADFLRIVTEVSGIIKEMKPANISFIQFDTEIHSVDNISSLRDLMKIKFTGRGGTDVQPVIEWANKNKPNVLLIFTDGGFYFRGLQTKVPTVWLIHDNKGFQTQFGKVIHYEMTHKDD